MMTNYINYKSFITCFFITITISFISCTDEEEKEPCVETICPDGFNNCIEKPCDY